LTEVFDDAATLVIFLHFAAFFAEVFDDAATIVVFLRFAAFLPKCLMMLRP